MKMIGEVMVMDIAQYVSSWLQTYLKQKTVSYASFYEEMQATSITKSDLEALHEKLDEEMSKEEKAAILEEVTKTQEALRSEMKKQPLKMSLSSDQQQKTSHGNLFIACLHYSNLE